MYASTKGTSMGHLSFCLFWKNCSTKVSRNTPEICQIQSLQQLMTGLMRCRDMTLRSSVTAGYASGEETFYVYVALSKI